MRRETEKKNLLGTKEYEGTCGGREETMKDDNIMNEGVGSVRKALRVRRRINTYFCYESLSSLFFVSFTLISCDVRLLRSKLHRLAWVLDKRLSKHTHFSLKT